MFSKTHLVISLLVCVQIEQLGGSPVKGTADRPPQLNVVSNPLSESPAPYDPGPKSPVEPTEFEVWFICLLFESCFMHLL